MVESKVNMEMEPSRLQDSKAKLPIEVTVVGMEMELREVQE